MVFTLIVLALAGIGWVGVVMTMRHILVYGPFDGLGSRGSPPLGTLLFFGVLAGVGTYWFGFGVITMWRRAVQGQPARSKTRPRGPRR